MITERTLRIWRRESIKSYDYKRYEGTTSEELARRCRSFEDEILRMTQELLDQHLLRK